MPSVLGKGADSVRVLMIAPQPYFRQRGTPISIHARLKALGDMGVKTDLLVYPFGTDAYLPGMRILRSLRVPFIHDVPIGPSLRKILLDLPLFTQALSMIERRHYDCVHTHEEASVLGAAMRKACAVPHIYDMHSCLSEQLANYGRLSCRPVVAVFSAIERWVYAHSDLIIAICPQLADTVRRRAPGVNVHTIENVPLSPVPQRQGTGTIPPEAHLQAGEEAVLYYGNLGYVQGLDLLIKAAVLLTGSLEKVKFWIAGGREGESEKLRVLAQELNLDDRIVFLGQRSQQELDTLAARAAVLISPRRSGTNVPLKMYYYLRAGKPLIATRIPAHTQILNEKNALLADPSPAGLAEALSRLFNDRALAQRLAEGAAKLAPVKCSYDNYLARVRDAYGSILPRLEAQPIGA